MPRFRTFRIAVAALAVLALAGCGKAQQMAAPQATAGPTIVYESSGLDPAQYSSSPTDTLTASQTIDGGQGGHVGVGSYRVDVPPGAIVGKATITIVQPDPAILQCELSISPESANKFLVPVILTVKLPSTTALVDQNFWFDNSASLWCLISTSPDAASLELHSQLWHFSKYATGRAGW